MRFAHRHKQQSIFILFSICRANFIDSLYEYSGGTNSIVLFIFQFSFISLRRVHASHCVCGTFERADFFYVTFASIVDNGIQAPTFLQEPLSRLIFSNDSGSQITCSAHGHPSPVVSWVHKDGSIVSSAPGLR